jgi:MFS family permease
LPGFQEHFGLGTGSSALKIRNFISIIYVGAGVGAALAFFINDRWGRLWSFRLYATFWIVGQMIAVSAPNLAALYASRIVSGLGMGALTTIGPMAITEISPPEIRGLLTSWFNVAMGIASTSGAFCVLGIYEHVPTSRLQYQIVWFAPCIFLALAIVASFFLCESPRWLFLVNRTDEATQTLAKLRGLPVDHPRMLKELAEIQGAIQAERIEHDDGLVGILKEAFLVPANLRRVQQSLVTYGLAQLSGANSITSYFVPILTIVGVGGGTARNMFLSAMVSLVQRRHDKELNFHSTLSPNCGSPSSRRSSSSMHLVEGSHCSLERHCR